MTWMHYFELLNAQTRFFPDGSIRAFAPMPKRWNEIEAFLRHEETTSRDRMEAAISQFILQGTWPEDLAKRDCVFMRGRLNFGIDTALRFAVPLMSHLHAPETPSGTQLRDILTWLLQTQWEALGLTFWMSDLESIYLATHRDSHSEQKEQERLQDWFSFVRREIRPPGF